MPNPDGSPAARARARARSGTNATCARKHRGVRAGRNHNQPLELPGCAPGSQPSVPLRAWGWVGACPARRHWGHGEPSQPPGRVGSEGRVTKSLSPACLLSRLPSSLPKLSRRGCRVRTGHHVAAMGRGHGRAGGGGVCVAGAGTCDRLGRQSQRRCSCAGPRATHCPSSGTGLRGPAPLVPCRGTRAPPAPSRRALRWQLMEGGSERWLPAALGNR